MKKDIEDSFVTEVLDENSVGHYNYKPLSSINLHESVLESGRDEESLVILNNNNPYQDFSFQPHDDI